MKSSNPTSRMTRLSPTKRPTAGVVTARLLAVLVVAMVITSILGFIASDELNPQKSRILLSLALLEDRTHKDIQELFYQY